MVFLTRVKNRSINVDKFTKIANNNPVVSRHNTLKLLCEIKNLKDKVILLENNLALLNKEYKNFSQYFVNIEVEFQKSKNKSDLLLTLLKNKDSSSKIPENFSL